MVRGGGGWNCLFVVEYEHIGECQRLRGHPHELIAVRRHAPLADGGSTKERRLVEW